MESILKSLPTLGFGDIQPKSGKGRQTLCFCKRKCSEMSGDAKAKLARLDINESNYDKVCQ